MTKEKNQSTDLYSQRIPRRKLLKLMAMAGLLAGCRPLGNLATPTSEPAPTTVPTPTGAPTAASTAIPTTEPTITPTTVPTTRPIPPKPEIIRFYPDAPSTVVHTHHSGVWDGETLVPGALRDMLDASITELTGLNDATEAWAALFRPNERIAIKVNAFRNSLIWTHVPLVMAVTECLRDAGIPAEQIVIFDYYTNELETAGFPVNEAGAGVRCYGTDSDYTAGWAVTNINIELCDILLNCDALINVPVLKSHMIAGISFALKNHYGTFSRPERLHSRIGRAMAELNALPPIKDRTRLIIGDVLTACLRHANSYPYWSSDMIGDSVLMSFDPVAHDAVGLQMFSRLLTDDGGNPAAANSMATPCLESSAELGLGTADPDNIELVELSLA